jgi:hypothetical protein
VARVLLVEAVVPGLEWEHLVSVVSLVQSQVEA